MVNVLNVFLEALLLIACLTETIVIQIQKEHSWYVCVTTVNQLFLTHILPMSLYEDGKTMLYSRSTISKTVKFKPF